MIPTCDIIVGDCIEELRKLPADSVHCVVTHGGHISQMPGVTRALFELYRELWDHHSQNDQAKP